MEADIKVYDTVDSTNTVLEELADNGAAEGTCVVAFSQRKGQGRSGRTFFSPEGGNLYMSFLLRPSDATDLITVTAAVATVEAIKETFNIDTGIKWVNDIIHHEKKVCGIVAKARNIGTPDFNVVIGIGINIYKCADVPADIADRYGSLIEKACDIPGKAGDDQAITLARNIMTKFFDHYISADRGRVIDLYRKYSIVIGKTVEYVCADTSYVANVIGIDDTGGIILERNGSRCVYHDGEIRISLGHDNLAL